MGDVGNHPKERKKNSTMELGVATAYGAFTADQVSAIPSMKEGKSQVRRDKGWLIATAEQAWLETTRWLAALRRPSPSFVPMWNKTWLEGR